MRVALMVPCYLDMFFPEVGVATLELLEKLGVAVEYPFDQTCCGQPMANSGAFKQAKATEELFVRNFAEYEYIVAPSGSCVHHIRNKFTAVEETPERGHVCSHVWDLPEFLCDVLEVQEFPWAEFPNEVVLHVSCSAIRGLYEQTMSERPNDPWFSKPRSLLEKGKGVSLVDFDRPDECCGFGGTFREDFQLLHPRPGPQRRRQMKPIDQARNALAFLEDETHEHAFDQLIWGLRERRDAAALDVPGVNTIAVLAEHLVVLLDPADLVPSIHHAYRHPSFREAAYAVLLSGPSGSADIGGITVHPAQGVTTLTVILSPPIKETGE